MINRSKQAARYGHVWTWGDHNKVIAGIEEIKLGYRGLDDTNNNLKETIDAYEALMAKIKGCKNITTVRNLLKDFYLPEKSGKVKKNLKVYLSGAAQETEYRQGVKLAYGKFLNLYDPIEMVDQDNPDLVNIDKKAINDSDIMVVFIQRVTFGTVMEIQYAYNLEKTIPIYVITSDKYVEDIWLSHHTSRFFPSIRKCFDFILNDFNVLPLEEKEDNK